MTLFQLQGIPWFFYTANTTRFWIHYGLVILGFVVAVITAIVQKISPAPYGKHDTKERNWGPQIPQRLSHMLSDGLPGILMVLLVFFLYGVARGPMNYVFLAMFLLHYIHRAVIHPFAMRYSSTTVSLGITLGGFVPNCIFHFVNADFFGDASFDSNYYYDPRFILGAWMFIGGFVMNRWADFKLRSLRKTTEENQFGQNSQINRSQRYSIPYGGLYELVSCPNYLGELIQWMGWTLATWSLAGLVWTLFCAATFVPRSLHNHKWYKQQFDMYPVNRKALVPFLF